jgi:prevent-host-death family protein
MSRKTARPMTKIISALTARTQLGQIMDRAQAERARFIVSRNGRPVIVILAIEDYLDSKLDTPEALAKLQAESRTRGLDLLSMDEINAEIASYRRERKRRRA